MDERWFQKRVMMAAEKDDCHFFKLTEMFAMGRPDLYIKHPRYSSGVWLELKWYKGSLNNPAKIELTPLQRQFMEREHRAGGRALWLVGIPSKDEIHVTIATGKNFKQDIVMIEDFIQVIRTRPKIEDINLYSILSVAFT